MNIQKRRIFVFRSTVIREMENRTTGESYYNVTVGKITIPRLSEQNLKIARIRVPERIEDIVRRRINEKAS